jgi:hypothetical protein
MSNFKPPGGEIKAQPDSSGEESSELQHSLQLGDVRVEEVQITLNLEGGDPVSRSAAA